MKIRVRVPCAGVIEIDSDEVKVLLSLQDLVKNPVEVELNPENVITIEAEEPTMFTKQPGFITVPGVTLPE